MVAYEDGRPATPANVPVVCASSNGSVDASVTVINEWAQPDESQIISPPRVAWHDGLLR